MLTGVWLVEAYEEVKTPGRNVQGLQGLAP